MAQTTIATQVHQSLDVHGHFATQIAFHRELGDFVAQLFHIGIADVLDLGGGDHSGGSTNLLRASAPDTVDRSQCDFGMLMIWNVYTGNTSHAATLFIQKS